jgi:hypothetical protein
VAYAFETILKITLIRAIGQNNLIESALGTLGMRDKIPKFILEISSIPIAKTLRMISCQHPDF